MQGIKDICDSERGVFAVLLLALVTALVVVGRVSSSDWLDYTKWLAVTFIAGKTVSHAIETLRPSQPIPTATTTTERTAP